MSKHDLPAKEVFAKTIYAEARGESSVGQMAVASVIKNRAAQNKSYFGGDTIKGVCLKDRQFSCWNDKDDIEIKEPEVYAAIRQWSDRVFDEPVGQDDPTGGADHYINPDKAGYPEWTKRCTPTIKIGHHQFYKQN